jgi:predicted amidophosphoribosyltransferase
MPGPVIRLKGVECRPERVKGEWSRGYALDEHTVSSIPDGAGGFITMRTALGQLVYDLKYNQKKINAKKLARVLAEWSRRKFDLDKIDGILGVPPSTTRKFQPVAAIVKRMSEILSLPDLSKKLRKTRATRSLKNVLDPDERGKELAGAFAFDREQGVRRLLLVDDLYRSGTTAGEVARTLKKAGVSKVYLVTATKTRVNR